MCTSAVDLPSAADAVYDVVGIGHPLLDVVTSISEAFLAAAGFDKGGMRLATEAEAAALAAQLSSAEESPGGSCANTLLTLARLRGAVAYIGKTRDDAVGAAFRAAAATAGLRFVTPPATTGPGSGYCQVMVTPDGQRTMVTFLGAAGQLTAADLNSDLIARARLLYLEGYLFDTAAAQQAFHRAAALACAAPGAPTRVALTLSDPFCVRRHRAAFRELVATSVEILFANHDELLALFAATSWHDALAQARDLCPIVCATNGARGSVILHGAETIPIDAMPTTVRDTTGAGDQYAAGVLFGLARGWSLQRSGRFGAALAALVIARFGAQLDRADIDATRAAFAA